MQLQESRIPMSEWEAESLAALSDIVSVCRRDANESGPLVATDSTGEEFLIEEVKNG